MAIRADLPEWASRMMGELATDLRRIKSALIKARTLRAIIRDAPSQMRRDAAIITYTRTVDDLMERLHRLDKAGVLDRALAAQVRQGTKEPDDGVS